MEHLVQEKDVERAQAGDREAFARLIKAHEAVMYRIAKSIMRSENECVDVAQEAVIKAYLSLDKLREPQFFSTWLIRILINECRRMARKNSTIVFMHEWKEEVNSQSFEEQIALEDAIDDLEEELRICITLHYVEDFPIKELAKILQIPEGTVKSRLSRARRKLAESLTTGEGNWRVTHE